MKKILSLLLCGVMLLSVSGCGEEEKKDDKNSDLTNNTIEKNNDVIEDVIKNEIYFCEQIDDDDITYTFYYENDKLTKVDIFSIYFDVYEDVKEEIKDEYYSGVSVNKTSDGVLIEVDLLNGGSTYLFDETFLYESQDKDLSWESVSEMAENSYLTCKLK